MHTDYSTINRNVKGDISMNFKLRKCDTMGASWSTEVSPMPQIICVGCGQKMRVEVPHAEAVTNVFDPARLVGTAVCRLCGTGTGFETKDNIIVYVAGEKSYGKIDGSLPELAKTYYSEAELCFQVGAPNGAAAMCRSSLEEAFTQAGYSGNSLYEMIDKAKTASALDDTEVSLAHGSRIITRNAIHRGELVPLTDVPAMLSAAVRILNKLASLVT
jgi:hypothetical protein